MVAKQNIKVMNYEKDNVISNKKQKLRGSEAGANVNNYNININCYKLTLILCT